MKAKLFLKFFLTSLVIFILVLVPIVKAVSDVNLFSEDTDGDGIGASADSAGVFIAETGSFYDKFGDDERINMLAMGVNNDMTDTIMVMSWDMKTDTVDVISVPRDTYYHRTGYDGTTEKKINAIYRSQGVKESARAVSDVLFGMKINYYAIIDYDSVRTIVDGVGGVPIDVKRDMYYTDPYDTPPLVIDIKKGQQTLDGEHAVQYLRYRHGYANGDLGRVEAQQVFVRSLYDQCIKNGVLSSAKLITKNIKSDLTVGAGIKYAVSAMGLKEGAIDSWTLPGTARYVDEISYFIQDKDATREMIRKIYQGESSSSGATSEEEEASAEA
ncbi:MAG: LCP family protein [Firmicutes bacterium]|nr:LCP family protein [Bacillota bacterium]